MSRISILEAQHNAIAGLYEYLGINPVLRESHEHEAGECRLRNVGNREQFDIEVSLLTDEWSGVVSVDTEDGSVVGIAKREEPPRRQASFAERALKERRTARLLGITGSILGVIELGIIQSQAYQFHLQQMQQLESPHAFTLFDTSNAINMMTTAYYNGVFLVTFVLSLFLVRGSRAAGGWVLMIGIASLMLGIWSLAGMGLLGAGGGIIPGLMLIMAGLFGRRGGKSL